MGTTARERSTTTRGRGPRAGRASGREDASGGQREEQYDLLTAALIGVVIGAGATMLLRRGPRGRPIVPLLKAAGRGAKWAGAMGLSGAKWARPHVGRGARWAGEHAADGAGWVADRGGELWDRVPVDDIREQVGDYLESARSTIADTVEHEIRDLRKAIRRQRKKLGV